MARRLQQLADASHKVVLPTDAGHTGRWADELPFELESGADVVLDLSRMDFVEPFFNARLAASLDRLAGTARRVRVVPPANPHVVNYMARMGIAAGLPRNCELNLPQVAARDRRDVLIPVTRLHDVDEVEPVAESFADLLEAQFGVMRADIGSALVLSLSELCDNAMTHGWSSYGAYVAAQRYQGTRAVLAIGDQGIGIPAHIRRTHRTLRDDGPALARATERGVSGTPDPDRGEGYRAIFATLCKLALPHASLRIWSGAGRLNLSLVRGEVALRSARTVPQTTPGAWVSIELSTT